jgi:hypothetical protein
VKVTYTSEDGTTFEREEDCLAYEAVSANLKQIFEGSPSQAEETLGFEDGFLSYFSQGFFRLEDLMRYQRSFLRLAELLQPTV